MLAGWSSYVNHHPSSRGFQGCGRVSEHYGMPQCNDQECPPIPVQPQRLGDLAGEVRGSIRARQTISPCCSALERKRRLRRAANGGPLSADLRARIRSLLASREAESGEAEAKEREGGRLGDRGGSDGDPSEYPAVFVGSARREVKRVGVAANAAVSERQSP